MLRFNNGLKSYICPFCYRKFGISDIKFRVNKSSAPKYKDEALTEYYGFDVHAPHFIPREKNGFATLINKIALPDKVKDKTTGEVADQKCCPHCHNSLPHSFEQVDTKIISIIGSRNSGKTHYITVLIEELKKLGKDIGLTLFAQDVGINPIEFTTSRFNREYREPLYGNHDQLNKTSETQSDSYPLIYELRSNNKVSGKVKSVYLVFYDTAGEVFNSRDKMDRLARYVTHSSGIIYLIDPAQLKTVSDYLKSKGETTERQQGSFQDILDIINQSLEKTGQTGPTKRSRIPVSVTFSKIDSLINTKLVPPDSTITEPPYYEMHQAYNNEEVELISEEIYAMLQNWGDDGFCNKVEAIFQKINYSGVSALGCTPVGGKIGDIQPHRVMDPLLWILDRMNFPLPKA